jgi:hypothetical protein
MSSNEDPIRRATLPPLDGNGVRHWPATATEADDALDSLAALREDLNALADCLVDFVDQLPTMVGKMVEARVKLGQAEVHAKIAEAHATLRGELKGYLTGLRDSTGVQVHKTSDFKFAGEGSKSDNEPIDLPTSGASGAR